VNGVHEPVVVARNPMKDLRTYEFGADAETLTRMWVSGVAPGHLEPVFRTMVSEIVSRVGERSRAVYLCSADEDAEARNRIAFLLAKLVREHVPTVLLVDCDFLSTGLGGVIPHRDALGFLDLLLYGTSLGVITQEAAHGVKVVGAGSFAVTKKSPFVIDAFVNARRYLVNQASCVIFVGPAMDDEGKLHPLAENVDLAVLVRTGVRFDTRFLDPSEQKVASTEGVEAWSVRMNTRTAAPTAGEPRGTEAAEPTLVAEVEDLFEQLGEAKPPAAREKVRPKGERAPSAETESFTEEPPTGATGPLFEEEGLAGPQFGKSAAGSRLIRVIISVVTIVLVAFVVWWLYLTRSVRERGEERVGAARPVPSTSQPSVPVTGSDSLRDERSAEPPPLATKDLASAGEAKSDAAAGHDGSTQGAVETPDRRKPAQTTASTPDSIHVAQTLDEFAGQYVIHAGSFRGINKAKEEAFYLLGWGYAVFIYRVDLESRGMWYRVYVGPYVNREDAMQSKIKLDGNPRIQSTRISKAPG
jgi:cell division septation protein DedD